MWQAKALVMGDEPRQAASIPAIMLPISFAFLVTVIVLLAIVTLPIWLPIAAASALLQKHWLLRKAAACNCPECGLRLGHHAVYAADEAVTRARDDWQKQHPQARVRTVKWLDAICQSCGAQLRWRAAGNSFVRLQPRDASHSGNHGAATPAS